MTEEITLFEPMFLRAGTGSLYLRNNAAGGKSVCISTFVAIDD
ncbi:MAG: hypothetical protein GPOALKHO_000551 [Sodalis sp.]|nr:MAG: hypothetical protein GPOALKHO_000551 [Sodalis sp.]